MAADFIGWVRNEINRSNIFGSEDELAAFLDRYIEKAGAVQEDALKRVFDAHEARNRQQLLKERDTAALCQSIHGLIAVGISRSAAPKEAQVLNTLIGAGFQ